MSGKVMIVGTGNVGASIAYALLNQRTAVKELILTDINAADAEGEKMDLRDALAVSPSFMKITSADYSAAKDADICVLTAGANQKPGETRLELLRKNVTITKQIVQEVVEAGFRGIFLVVANPVDILTQVAFEVSGFYPERVIGSGTVLDSARLRYQISQKLGVHPKSIHAYQVGEHGDSEVTLWQEATVGGAPISNFLSAKKRLEISDFVTHEAYQIIEKKGATHYGIGTCAVQIINCILNDENRVLAVSNYDDVSQVFYGFPAVVGRSGIRRRIDLDLPENEGVDLQKSINVIKNSFISIQNEIKTNLEQE